jgi:peroxiredoxin
MRNLSLVVLASALVAGAALAQDIPRDQTPPVNPGPTTSKSSQPRGKAPIIGEVAIGERAPDFLLDTSLGKSQKLSRLRGDWVLLLFGDRYRSLAVFDSLDVPARQLGARIVGVCHEKQQTLTGVAARDSLRLLMFADATGEVAAMYGVYDWRYGTTDPGFFVIDRDGIVRLAVIGKLFPPDQMLELVRFATGELN